MISSNSDALTTGADVSVPQSDLSRFLKRLGIAIVVVGLAFAAAFMLTPYQPNEANFLMRLKPPSATHWFGTDNLGRDVVTRILYGAGWSLGLAFLISGLGAVVGVLVGLSAGSAPR
ncbi:MAG TPA: sodium:proton antiporter, partial [Rhizobiales bacterium]|nr:sodium:proton antiporter [Hyphomicrobiales bacterium]